MSYLVHKVDGQTDRQTDRRTDRRTDDTGLCNTLDHVNMAEGKNANSGHGNGIIVSLWYYLSEFMRSFQMVF